MIHIRQPAPAQSPQVQAKPASVVWLNRGTLVLWVFLALLVLGVGLSQLARAPWFAITQLQVRGDTQFHNALTLKANVLPQLTGNYFSLDLRRAQALFEALPWIRSAVVQRSFPGQLQVHLTAHVPAAKWTTTGSQSAQDSERLMNVQGEVFDAAGGPIDTDALPELEGPAQSAVAILSVHQALSKSIRENLDPALKVLQLSLSEQGLWRAVLSNDATVELGSGQPDAVMARANAWLAAMPNLASSYGARTLHSADLRYASGFAVRMAGITTQRPSIQ